MVRKDKNRNDVDNTDAIQKNNPDSNDLDGLELPTEIIDNDNSKTKIMEIKPDDKTYIIEENGIENSHLEKTKIITASANYYLLAIYGPYKGKCYQLNSNETRIGRVANLNDIVIKYDKNGIPDTSISRRHATITVKNGRFYLFDKRSKTRTWHNSIKLAEDDIVELKEKDEIELVSDKMSTIFRFVKQGNWDFSPPQKAGVWWIKYRSLMLNLTSIILATACIMVLLASIFNCLTISQKPKEIKIQARQWISGASIDTGNRIKDENNIYYDPSPVLSKAKNKKICVIFLDGNGHILGYDGKTGKPLWPDIQSNAILPFSPVLADFEGDDNPEVFISSTDSRVLAYDVNFGMLKYKSDLLGGKLACSPSSGDLNGDGRNDLVVCSEDGWLYKGINSGGKLDWYRQNLNVSIRGVPTLADLTGDGKGEILIGTEDGKLLICSDDENVKIVDINDALRGIKGSYSESHSFRNSVAVSGTEQNSGEILLLTRELNALVLNLKDRFAMGYDEFENTGFQYPISYPAPLACDLDLDNIPEFIVTVPNGTVHAFKNQMKNKLWSFQGVNNEIFINTPALCDFTKDGIPDIAIAGSSGTFYLVDGKTGQSLFSKTYQNRSFTSAPVIGDIDGDGWIDLLVQCDNQDIIKFTSNTKLFTNAIPWPQYIGAANHAGLYSYELPSLRDEVWKIIVSTLFIALLLFFHGYQKWCIKKLAKKIQSGEKRK